MVKVILDRITTEPIAFVCIHYKHFIKPNLILPYKEAGDKTARRGSCKHRVLPLKVLLKFHFVVTVGRTGGPM